MLRLPTLILILLLPLRSLAVDLFDAQMPVADESAETRNAALAGMLEQVLVRVSGNDQIAGQPAARDILAAAPSLVQQYRYRSVEQGDGLVRTLWARFDQATVERMLRDRGLPVWTQRPEVLLWLGVEQAGQRRLLPLDSEPDARDALLARAAERGLPLQLPLMDLEDQGALLPADLWSDYLQAIRAASARYPHDRILTGRLTAVGNGRWRGAWTLIGPSDTEPFQSPTLPLDETLRYVVDRAQNLLAARYAPMPGGQSQGGVMVRFGGVDDLAGYAALLQLLEGLEPVSQAALRFVDGSDLVFEFTLRGDIQNLQRALQASGRLIAEPLPPAPVSLPSPVPSPPVPPAGTAGTGAAGETAGAVQPPASFAPVVDYAYRLVD
jgi:hypothetical protein